MKFEPRDPNFEARTRENFSSQGFMQTLGTQMTKLEPGRLRCRTLGDDHPAHAATVEERRQAGEFLPILTIVSQALRG